MHHRFRIKLIFFTTILLFAGSFAFANPDALTGNLPPRPHHSYVYDENRLLSAQQEQYFNQLAEELYRKTGAGLAAALMNDIGFIDARTFATAVAHKWGVGGKSDEGILIFVALKQRRRSVEVGYGAEGYLPDVLVERLQQKTLVPAFRVEKYGDGILALAYQLAQIIAKEKGVTLNIQNANIPQEQEVSLPGWIFIAFVFLFLVFARGNRSNQGLWFLLGLLTNNGNHRNGRGGFGGGFGCGRGGFGGGGFGGGFGGGRFGGGGSGGNW